MKNTIKKISALVLVVALGATLSACGGSKLDTSTPYGTITGEYGSLNNVKLSNKTLYDMMRLQGFSTFNIEVETIVLKDYIDAIDFNNEEDAKDLQEIANTVFFGTDEIEDIFYMSDKDKNITKQQIIDAMFASNITITADDIVITIDEVTYPETVKEFFKLDIAKRRYAQERLDVLVNEEEVEDPNGEDGEMMDNVYYISDKDIENYYNSTYRNQQDFNAVIVGFNSVAAYEAATNGMTFTDSNAKTNFITLYNNAFKYKEQLTTSNFDELTILNSDKLSAYNSSLAAFVTNMDAKTYTTSYKEFGDKVYMIYKDTDLSDLEWKELSDNGYTESDIAEIEKEIREELYDSKLSNSFVANQVAELIDDLVAEDKIKIYDPVFSLAFASKYDYEDANLTSKTDVAVIDGTTIKVDDFFKVLEEVYGTSLSLDFFLSASLAGKFDLTKDEKEDAEDAYKAAVKKYENNTLSTSGLTKDFSLEQFLTMQYGFSNKADVIKYYFQPQEAKHYFTEQFNDLYFELFESVGKNSYEQYFSLDIVHMLLFVDADMDGNLDNPEEFMRDLSDANKVNFQKTIVEIYATVYEEAKFLSLGYEKSLNYIVKAYNDDAKIAYLNDGTTWNDIKTKYGMDFNIQMKVENLGEVNNGNASNYVESFSTHVRETYFDLMATIDDNEDFNDNFKELLDKENLELIDTSTNFDDVCMSTFGFHMLLSTGGKLTTSAEFTADNDRREDYKEIEIELNDKSETVNGYTENHWPSVNQLKVYVSELEGDDGVVSLKTSTETIIDGFYSTFNTRYTSDVFLGYLLIIEYDLINEIKFTDTNKSNILKTTLEISQRSIDNYADMSNTVFADWWTILEATQA